MDTEKSNVESEARMFRRRRPGRWIVEAAGAVQGCCIVGILLLAALAIAGYLGFINPLERPASSEAGYVAKYMTHFDEHQIEKIDYVYHGAIGGVMTAARVQFKGPVKVHGAAEVRTYNPTAIANEPAGLETFKHEWEVHCGNKTPAWFDFPFDCKMRMFRDAREGSKDEPRHCYEWYIDDQRNLVYFRGNWG